MFALFSLEFSLPNY